MNASDIRKAASDLRQGYARQAELLIALADVVDAGITGQCRHDTSLTGLNCPMCVALARVEAL